MIRTAGKFIAIVLLLSCQLQAAIRIATYNVNQGVVRGDLPTVLTAMNSEVVNGISGPIDLLFLQEQNPSADVQTTPRIADIMNQINSTDVYLAGTVYPNAISSGGSPGVVYNSEIVELLDETGIATSGPRTPVRYTFRLIGYSSPDAIFYVYCCHLKAGSGSSEEATRASEALSIRQNADALGADKNVIYLGDFNLYDNAEGAWTNFTTGTGVARGYDPVSALGGWTNKLWHTQSPRKYSSGTLIGGGMDDRFDFQLITSELNDSDGLAIISNTYHGFGNNGTHWINYGISTGSGATPSVLSALESSSDHLPVIVEYQVPAIMSVQTSEIDVPKVIYPGYTLGVYVSNDVHVDNTNEADDLEYTIETITGSSPQWGDLPSGWSYAEIGTISQGFDSAYKSEFGEFMVKGTGNISGFSDNFYYVYKDFSGDGEFYYRLDSVTGDNVSAVAGIMIRQDLSGSSPFAMLHITESQQVSFRRRTYQNGIAMATPYTSSSLPKWLKLSRSGTTISSYTSDDGQIWTPLYSDYISMAADIYVGFAVATYNSTFTTANFSIPTGGGSNGTVYTDAADQIPSVHNVELLTEKEGDTTITLNITGVGKAVENAEYTQELSYRVTHYQDFDGDLDFDINDINLFLNNIGTTEALYDLDGSGFVDSTDQDILIYDVMAVYYGDTNLDRSVDINDLAIVTECYLTPSANSGWENGDFNGDGFVDMKDFALLSGDWEK